MDASNKPFLLKSGILFGGRFIITLWALSPASSFLFFSSTLSSLTSPIILLQLLSILKLSILPFPASNFSLIRRVLSWLLIIPTHNASHLPCLCLWTQTDALHVVGVGITLTTNAAPVLVTELAYPTQRGSISALYNTLWYSGSIMSAWVCYATLRILPNSHWEWR